MTIEKRARQPLIRAPSADQDKSGRNGRATAALPAAGYRRLAGCAIFIAPVLLD
jgi:hypothetical protein